MQDTILAYIYIHTVKIAYINAQSNNIHTYIHTYSINEYHTNKDGLPACLSTYLPYHVVEN